MASVHFSVDHLCGYAQHFPLIPCGGDLLSLNYAQKPMVCVISWVACFYQQHYCKKDEHFPSDRLSRLKSFSSTLKVAKVVRISFKLGERNFTLGKAPGFVSTVFMAKCMAVLKLKWKGRGNSFNSSGNHATLIIILLLIKIAAGTSQVQTDHLLLLFYLSKPDLLVACRCVPTSTTHGRGKATLPRQHSFRWRALSSVVINVSSIIGSDCLIRWENLLEGEKNKGNFQGNWLKGNKIFDPI